MVYYFLPGRGRFGGVKVGIQFVELLASLGVHVTAVLPDGRRPAWFANQAPVIAEAQVWATVTPADWLMITWPPDYGRIKDRGRLVCHCQGTDDRMEPIFADADVPILTCWAQADDHVRAVHGRATTFVGIAVSDCFFHNGGRKWDNRVAYMPRRGWATVKACMRVNSGLDYQPIDGLDELAVSRRLQSSGVYLATSAGEEFGLPALEAMAAGCAVVSVPVKGGVEYLHSGTNCLVGSPAELPDLLRWLSEPRQEQTRHLFRSRSVSVAKTYTLEIQRSRLAVMLERELAWLRS